MFYLAILYKKYEELLKKNKVTTYQVCKKENISRAVISAWKAGRTNPSINNLMKIARYFGVSITYFIDEN